MTLIAGILLTEGTPYVEEIRKALMGGSFLFTLAGFAEGVWLASEDMKGQLVNFVKIAVIVSLAAGFPTIIQKGDEALSKLHSSISQGQQDAFRAQIEADAEEPSWSDIPSRISYSIGVCLQKIGLIGYQIIYWAKDITILLLISVSPLLIGFLAFSYTRSIGINFLITSLTVILWNIGFVLVDTLLIILGNIVMPMMGVGATGAAVVTAGPLFLSLCLVSAVLPIAMYCSVPIITGAIMRGTNIAGAAMAAYGIAHQTVSHGGAVAGGMAAAGRSLINSGSSMTSEIEKSIAHAGSSNSGLSSTSYGSSGPFMASAASSSTPSSPGSNNSPQASGPTSSAGSSDFANNKTSSSASSIATGSPSPGNFAPQNEQEPIVDIAEESFNKHENSPYMA